MKRMIYILAVVMAGGCHRLVGPLGIFDGPLAW